MPLMLVVKSKYKISTYFMMDVGKQKLFSISMEPYFYFTMISIK